MFQTTNQIGMMNFPIDGTIIQSCSSHHQTANFQKLGIFCTAFLVRKGIIGQLLLTFLRINNFAQLQWWWSEQPGAKTLGDAGIWPLCRTHQLCSPEEDPIHLKPFATNHGPSKEINLFSQYPAYIWCHHVYSMSHDLIVHESRVILIFKGVPTVVTMTWRCFWFQPW